MLRWGNASPPPFDVILSGRSVQLISGGARLNNTGHSRGPVHSHEPLDHRFLTPFPDPDPERDDSIHQESPRENGRLEQPVIVAVSLDQKSRVHKEHRPDYIYGPELPCKPDGLTELMTG